MATEANFSAYQRYKRDTTLFTTWLSNTAITCGWKAPDKLSSSALADTGKATSTVPANVKSARLKGKARKAAKDTAKDGPKASTTPPTVRLHSLTTKELLDQVNLVAQSPRSRGLSMPDRIWEALQGAIHSRQRFCDWFDRMKLSTQEARDGHRHFVDVLKSAFEVLPRESPFKKPTKTSKATSDSAKLEEDVVFMKNAFEALEVEDIFDEDFLSVADVAKPAASSESHVYHLEVDRQSEAAFIVFSFFEDLHRLRSEVKNVWARYRDGNTQLLHATVVTAAAMEMARQAEREAYDAYVLTGEPTENTYAAFIGLVYIANALPTPERETVSINLLNIDTSSGSVGLKSKDTSEPKPFVKKNANAVEITPMDEFVFLPAARTLTKIAQCRQMIKERAWPPIFPGMRSNFIARPELLDDPRYQLFERQDTFIGQLVIDMTLDDQLRHRPDFVDAETRAGFSRLTLRWDDPLCATLRQVWTEGTITATMVWAAQLAFDISEACHGGPGGLQATRDAARHIQETFGFHRDSSGALDTRDVRWLKEDCPNLLNINKCMSLHMVEPMVMKSKEDLLRQGFGHVLGKEVPPQVQAALDDRLRATGWTPPSQEHAETAKRIGAGNFIEYNEDREFLMKANILHTGTLLLDVTSMVEVAGVGLANYHVSIFGMAHLYNALMQLGICKTHWPEMDRIIELHQGPIFANDIPTKPQDIVARFQYRTGISNINSHRFAAKQPWKMQTTAATQALRKFFLANENLSQVLSTLSDQAETHQLHPYQVGNTARPGASSQRREKQLQLTPRQALLKLEKYVDAVLPDIQIDYVNLTRQFNEYLRHVRTQIASETGHHYSSIGEPGETSDIGLCLVVYGILLELKTASTENSRGGRSRGQGRATEGHVDRVLERAPHTQIAKRLLEEHFGLGGT